MGISLLYKGDRVPNSPHTSPPTKSDRPGAAGHPVRPFAELPANLRKKITIEPGMERTGCWLWTGYVRKERQRFRLYPTPADYGGMRNSIGSIQGERATPEVRDPQRGHRKVPVHRRVYGLLTGIHIDDVPTLARCLNEKCVSPHHVLETGPTPKEVRRRAAEIAEGISFEDPQTEAKTEAAPVVDVMETLKSKRPSGWLDAASAEIECDLLPGLIKPEVWAEYVVWDEENPEDDEE